ncbi:hypothetical protein CCU68_28200 [Pseudomonas gingeri NCPPB 3146 = LMG 5327]|uniref:AAA family ATPase n=2 Tax=Pseudomonas gingeri TaxID=117681 RepID=A0A7Y7XW18_9PSED|nr:AAA family ATPase [Pseudomonas gingeri]NWC12428.1 AAA family ATPase [Pseudomonas gingeri]PNQ89185.1 hypothetical protein CCU68_28200 [Pseudomonas gingeri NCPPB 3146 = LMG 5327]
MRVKIEDFGPVSSFEFDSDKIFQLIVGDNNIGKSYVLSAYYFVVKSLLDLTSLPFRYYRFAEFMETQKDSASERADAEVDKFLKARSGSKDVDITHFYKECVKGVIGQSFLTVFSEYVDGSYREVGSVVNKMSGAARAKITVSIPKLQFTLSGDVGAFVVSDVDLDFKVVYRESKQNRDPIYQNNTFVIYKTAGVKEHANKIRLIAVRETLTKMLGGLNGFKDINYLPASRSGLYQALSAFGQIIAELSKSRSFLSSRIELPAIPRQLSDYFIKLTSISDVSTSTSELSSIADKIESSVLRGKIEYDFEEKRLYYKPEGTDLRLDLSATSSMVSEIGPIVVYIRHILGVIHAGSKGARKARDTAFKTVLVIEEPEAHLHPDNQLKMTELYAELAKYGVHVVMTSHSNYVFNKVSNLIVGGKLLPDQVKCDLFEITEQGSVGRVQEIDEYGIDDNNFVDASESLLTEKLELLGAKSK